MVPTSRQSLSGKGALPPNPRCDCLFSPGSEYWRECFRIGQRDELVFRDELRELPLSELAQGELLGLGEFLTDWLGQMDQAARVFPSWGESLRDC